MKPEKEFDEELDASLKMYKIAGVIIVLLLLIGVLYVVLKKEKPDEKPQTPVPTVAPTAEPTIAPTQNISQSIAENRTVNKTADNLSTNATSTTAEQNTTRVTAAQLLNLTVPTPTQVNYSWNGIKIAFPDTLKKIPSSKNSNQYIEILESDGTPVSNEEQFDVSFTYDNHYGKKTEVTPTYEKNKWLITLLISNKGSYTLIVTVKCEDKIGGHCRRFYGAGSAQGTSDFEVI